MKRLPSRQAEMRASILHRKHELAAVRHGLRASVAQTRAFIATLRGELINPYLGDYRAEAAWRTALLIELYRESVHADVAQVQAVQARAFASSELGS